MRSLIKFRVNLYRRTPLMIGAQSSFRWSAVTAVIDTEIIQQQKLNKTHASYDANVTAYDPPPGMDSVGFRTYTSRTCFYRTYAIHKPLANALGDSISSLVLFQPVPAPRLIGPSLWDALSVQPLIKNTIRYVMHHHPWYDGIVSHHP